MTLRAWISKLWRKQAPPPEPPPSRGLDEPIIHGPEEEADAAKDRAADLNERLGKAEEDDDRPPPGDPLNP